MFYFLLPYLTQAIRAHTSAKNKMTQSVQDLACPRDSCLASFISRCHFLLLIFPCLRYSCFFVLAFISSPFRLKAYCCALLVCVNDRILFSRSILQRVNLRRRVPVPLFRENSLIRCRMFKIRLSSCLASAVCPSSPIFIAHPHALFCTSTTTIPNNHLLYRYPQDVAIATSL
jgi:hypothetical protein